MTIRTMEQILFRVYLTAWRPPCFDISSPSSAWPQLHDGEDTTLKLHLPLSQHHFVRPLRFFLFLLLRYLLLKSSKLGGISVHLLDRKLKC